ncbi:MAG: hypothetical protein ACJAUL_002448, partial [Paraglaciecola sp.]
EAHYRDHIDKRNPYLQISVQANNLWTTCLD